MRVPGPSSVKTQKRHFAAFISPRYLPAIVHLSSTSTRHRKMPQWRYGLLKPSDCATCLGSIFCTCCLYSRAAYRSSHFPQALEDGDYSDCSGHTCLMLVASHLSLCWIPQCLQRASIRKTYDIDGSTCGDCCASFWCQGAVAAQINSELKERALEEKARMGGAVPYHQPQILMQYQRSS